VGKLLSENIFLTVLCAVEIHLGRINTPEHYGNVGEVLTVQKKV
jgi:hypothetical protein